MAERPILFSGPMVRAILSNQKTQTRRPLQHQPPGDTAKFVTSGERWYHQSSTFRLGDLAPGASQPDAQVAWVAGRGERSPYGVPGDRLWVKEEHWAWGRWALDGETATGRRKFRFVAVAPPAGVDAVKFERKLTDSPTVKRNGDVGWVYRHARFMPRAASRIDLEIVSVRVERLQDITEDDALAEGVGGIAPEDIFDSARSEFQALWDEINGDRATWESNPWVWVVEFKRVQS